MTLTNQIAGLRILDVEHGFRLTNPEPIIEGELGNTLLLGKALNLALHLRGLNVLQGDDLKGLTYAAAAIGIGAAELNTVLRELREIDWVRLLEVGTKIQRVEIVVPELRDGFDIVGARWRELGPTEIEEATVTALADAVIRPYPKQDLQTTMGMSKQLMNDVLDIGEAGTFLRVHRLDNGEKLVYSPLFGDSNPEKAYEITRKYGDKRVRELIDHVHEKQGLPEGSLPGAAFVREAILSGLILAPGVKDKRFIFTPHRGVAPEEVVILDKARAIVACVRYGENFAGITKILYPRLIIDALIAKKKLKPHSEHLEQYGLLVKKGIGRVEKVGTRWQFSVLSTEDNLKALRVARDLLDTGDAVHQQLDDGVRARILNPSATYSTPVAERVKLNRNANLKNADAKTNTTISNLIRGAIEG